MLRPVSTTGKPFSERLGSFGKASELVAEVIDVRRGVLVNGSSVREIS
jgi:hypothetical protein